MNSKNTLLKKNGLKDLKKEITKMSEEEKKIEDPKLIAEIVEEILKFNEQNQSRRHKNINTKPNS